MLSVFLVLTLILPSGVEKIESYKLDDPVLCAEVARKMMFDNRKTLEAFAKENKKPDKTIIKSAECYAAQSMWVHDEH